MNKVKKVPLICLCMMVLLILVACVIPDQEMNRTLNEIGHLFDRINDIDYCHNKGLSWDPETKECVPATPPEVVIVEPVGPANQPPNPPDQTSEEEIAKPTPNARACLVYSEAIEWWYEDVNNSSGTGGTTCSGKLTFQNNSPEAAIFELYTLYDNGTMKDSNWQGYPVIAGGKSSVQVSSVKYSDGTITYNHVPLLLAVRDIPACFYMFTDESEQQWYDVMATEVEELPCP